MTSRRPRRAGVVPSVLRCTVMASAALLAAGLTSCTSGPVADEVARYGPDTSGLVEPGLRVELGADADLRALGVPEGELDLPALAPGVRRLGFTYEACELVDVEPVVTEDGRVRLVVERDERVGCGQPQYWLSVVEVPAGDSRSTA